MAPFCNSEWLSGIQSIGQPGPSSGWVLGLGRMLPPVVACLRRPPTSPCIIPLGRGYFAYSPLPPSDLLRPLHLGKTTIPAPLATYHSRRMATTMDPGSTNSGDPGTAFTLLLSCPSGLPRSQLSVDFSPSYDRTPHPDVSLEQSIEEIWNRCVQENPSLYNGKKFRYAGHVRHDVDALDQVASVCLHLGLTDYRTFMGTNLSPLWDKLLVPSEDDSVCCQHMSSPLGNGAIVETADKKILVLQRSYNVGEFPGYFVFPGGHSEPQEIGISAHQADEGMTGLKQLNEKVSQEMFDGIIREVVEEIGVPANSLTDPVFIGISRRRLNVRPTAFFFLECDLDSKEIYQLYSQAQDGYESTQLYTVSRDDLTKMTLKMPGCHRGGFSLYELMIKVASDI